MTLILTVGDIHISDHAPSGATETYQQDLLDMLTYIADLERDLNADAVVWLGDIFHFKQPSRTSHATILKMIEVTKRYRNLYIVTGNHDISNDVLASVHEKQPLGVLLAAGYAKELDGWHPTLPLYGVPWQQRWLHEGVPAQAFEAWQDDAQQMEGKTNALKLAVTHAPLFPSAVDVPYELVPTEVMAAAMGNEGHLAFGHIHEYHGVFVEHGVTFCNYGALSRGSLAEYNYDRPIAIGAWTDQDIYGSTELYGDFEFKVGFNQVNIPHKPAAEVLRIAEKMEDVGAKLSLDKFLGDIGSSTLNISSTENVVAHIRGLKEAPPVVRERAIEILETVK